MGSTAGISRVSCRAAAAVSLLSGRRLAFPTYAAYGASKGAVEAMTLILARELRGRDITVNAVAPGPDRHRPVPRRQGPGDDRPARQAAAARAPRTPEDLAAVVAFLAGPDGHWVNGQVVRANGGIV